MVSGKEQSGVEARVLSVVTEVLAIEGEPPALDSSLIEDLGADSLDLLSVFMALEDEFGGTISEEDTEAWQRFETSSNVSRADWERTRSRVRAEWLQIDASSSPVSVSSAQSDRIRTDSGAIV